MELSQQRDVYSRRSKTQLIRQAVGMALLGVTQVTCNDLEEKSLTYPISSITSAFASTSTIFRNLTSQPVLKFLRKDMPAGTVGYILVSTDTSGQKISKITFKNVSEEKIYKNVGTIAQPRFVEGTPKVTLQQDCTVPSLNGVR